MRRRAGSFEAEGPSAVFRTEIFQYIELFYNQKRLHQSLNYQTPMQYKTITVSPNELSVKPGAAHGEPPAGTGRVSRAANGWRAWL